MPPKKEKKPRKPRAKKEGVKQKQSQKQVINIHIGAKGKSRDKVAPKANVIPPNFIMMNAPPLPLPQQFIQPTREPLREITEPTRLGTLTSATADAEQARMEDQKRMAEGVRRAEMNQRLFDAERSASLLEKGGVPQSVGGGAGLLQGMEKGESLGEYVEVGKRGRPAGSPNKPEEERRRLEEEKLKRLEQSGLDKLAQAQKIKDDIVARLNEIQAKPRPLSKSDEKFYNKHGPRKEN